MNLDTVFRGAKEPDVVIESDHYFVNENLILNHGGQYFRTVSVGGNDYYFFDPNSAKHYIVSITGKDSEMREEDLETIVSRLIESQKVKFEDYDQVRFSRDFTTLTFNINGDSLHLHKIKKRREDSCSDKVKASYRIGEDIVRVSYGLGESKNKDRIVINQMTIERKKIEA